MHAILRRLGFGRHAARAGGTPTTFMASARRRGRAAIRESLRLESLECRRLLAVAMNDEFSVLEDRFGNQLPVLRNDQGDGLRIVEVGRPSAGGTVRIGDDGLVYSPRHDFHGAESFEYKVVDAEGDTDAARVVVHVENVNDPPTAENDRFRVEPDSEGNILRPLRNDTFRPDPEERLRILSVGTPSHGGELTIVEDGTAVSYTPAEGFLGIEEAVYEITDGNGGTDQASVEILVDVPQQSVVANPDRFEVRADSGRNRLDVLANDVATSNSPLQVVEVSEVEGGHVTIADDGSHVIFVPRPGFRGTTTFRYVVADAAGNTDSAPVTVFVHGDAPGPVAHPDRFRVRVDSEDNILDVLLNDQTELDFPLKIVEVSPSQLAEISIVDEGSLLSLTPFPGFVGEFTFLYVIEDGNGLRDEGLVHVTVVDGENRPPVAHDDEFVISLGDVNVLVHPLDVLDNDLTEPDERLRVTEVTQTDGGHVEIGPDGQVVLLMLGPNLAERLRFEYTVSDGNGGTDQATVVVHLERGNRPPVAHPDRFHVRADSERNEFDVLANDQTEPGETLQILEVGEVDGGVVTIADGRDRLFFTPDAGFEGTVEFKYVVGDGNGGRDDAVVHVLVGDVVNRPPVAHDDEFVIPLLDANGLVHALDVLANDLTEPDERLRVIEVTQPDGGRVEIGREGQVVLLVLGPNLAERLRFEYTVSDGNGGTDQATVVVHMRPFLDPSPARDDAFRVEAGSSDNLLDVLANDAPNSAGGLEIVHVEQPEHGQAVWVEGGLISFTPADDFVGVVEFSYAVAGADGALDRAVVVVTVVAPEGDPLGNGDPDDDPLDVNGDDRVSPQDVVIVINEMERQRFDPTARPRGGGHFVDVNGDGIVSAHDALLIVNHVNRNFVARSSPRPPTEPDPPTAGAGLAAHLAIPAVPDIESPESVDDAVAAVQALAGSARVEPTSEPASDSPRLDWLPADEDPVDDLRPDLEEVLEQLAAIPRR